MPKRQSSPAPKYLTTPKKTASRKAAKKQPAKRVAAKKTAPKGQYLTMPKKKASKAESIAAPAHANQKRARKTFKGERVAHFIEAAAVSPSVVQAVKTAEGSVTMSEATELVKDPEVVSAILNVRQSLAQECGITSKRIMSELASIGFSNMLDYMTVTKDGQPITDFSELTREQAAAIQEITVEEYMERKAGTDDEYERVKRTKFKLYPKRESLVDMAKHLGIKGFGNPLTAKVGMKMTANPDGSFESAVVVQLSDEELHRIAAGIDDSEENDERTE